MQEQHKVTSAARWEEKAQIRGEFLERAREVEEARALKQADLERRSALLAEKLRTEELAMQEAVLNRKASTLTQNCSILLISQILLMGWQQCPHTTLRTVCQPSSLHLK